MILTELPRRMEEQETHMEKWMKGRYMANQKRLSVGTGVPAPRGRGIVMLILLVLVVALAAVSVTTVAKLPASTAAISP